MPTRREFIRTASSLAALLAAPRLARAQVAAKAATPLKLLILGGTGFLGPCVVRRAVARGHSMTLFNRGRTDPAAFPELEKLKGDRNSGDLAALEGREFDAVIDTSGYFPKQVRESAALLAPNCSHYVFVSTISVYKPLDATGAGEDAPLETLAEGVDPDTLKTIGANYGALKALCEQAAEAEMPGLVTNVRPGLIVGPDDDSDRFTYWPVRVAGGGEVLAPGTPEDPVQFIDVRDLANFIVRCIEDGALGTMNATGPEGGLPIGRLLQACKEAAGSDARFVFVPDEFLDEQKLSAWSDLPAWVSPRKPGGGLMNLSVSKAVAAGLEFRPAVETARDTLEWFRSTQGGRALRAGMKREVEAKALDAWRARGSNGGS